MMFHLAKKSRASLGKCQITDNLRMQRRTMRRFASARCQRGSLRSSSCAGARFTTTCLLRTADCGISRPPYRRWAGFSAMNFSSLIGGTERVRIGNVERELGHFPSDAPQLVPQGYLPDQPSQTLLEHLQWMMTKDNLKQDMLLIGPPGDGASYRRRIAMMYAEMTQREVEILTLSSDVTESDLKQRRELVSSSSGSGGASVAFFDQAPVRAAIHGRLLILDGLEKAERNVLPTLNNLLENREMHLEDGRFLVSPERFEELREKGVSSSSVLFPTHSNFRVVALGVPVPPFDGRTLDPPLRSRFQIRRIDNQTPEEVFETLIMQGVNPEDARQYAIFAGTMENAAMTTASGGGSRTPTFPSAALSSVAKIMEHFRLEEKRSVLARSYPFGNDDDRLINLAAYEHQQARKSFSLACDKLQIGAETASRVESNAIPSSYEIRTVSRNTQNPLVADVTFSSPLSFHSTHRPENTAIISVPCGAGEIHQVSPHFIHTMGTKTALKAMMQEHFAGRDMLLISPKGEGKTATAMEFASILGYRVELFGLYKDMSSRDLLMRRTADSVTGETKWEASPLVKAAVDGSICILDGVEKLNKDSLSVLQSLVIDREISLPDGRKLLRHGRSSGTMSQNAGDDASSLQVHEAFRVIAKGSVSKDWTAWLSEDICSMFSSIVLPAPSEHCLREILKSSNPICPDRDIDKIIGFHKLLTDDAAADCGVSPLSTRNMIRIVKQISPSLTTESDLHDSIYNLLMGHLLPPAQRAALDTLLRKADIKAPDSRLGTNNSESAKKLVFEVDDEYVKCGGGFVMKRGKPKRKEMVPSPIFFDIPHHTRVIGRLLKEWNNGERSFLLLGNQGVGKNKIVDRLCELANFEREYIQLHRDSTVGQLTMSPALDEGKIVWKDSPLVRAVVEGCSLVIDEADKAPLETVAVLKNLIEDGELLLADGRRITRKYGEPGTIHIHPSFTVWVLANRPGFPFHGNDFFREVGDCFSTHAIPNPDRDSEIELLHSYAPDVEPSTLQRIVASFAELRQLADSGDISYPYSTREAVSVVKHLQKYPGLVSALHNVLDMDSFDERLYSKISGIFSRNGIPISLNSKKNRVNLAPLKDIEKAHLIEKWYLANLGRQIETGEAYQIESELVKTDPIRLKIDPPSRSPFTPEEGRTNEFSELVRKWNVTGSPSFATCIASSSDNAIHVLTRNPTNIQSYYGVIPESRQRPTCSTISFESFLPHDLLDGEPVMAAVPHSEKLAIYFPGGQMLVIADVQKGVLTGIPVNSEYTNSFRSLFGRRSWTTPSKSHWSIIPNSCFIEQGLLLFNKGEKDIYFVCLSGHDEFILHRISLPMSVEDLTISERGIFVIRFQGEKDGVKWIGSFPEQMILSSPVRFTLQQVAVHQERHDRGLHPEGNKLICFADNNFMLTEKAVYNSLEKQSNNCILVFSSPRDEMEGSHNELLFGLSMKSQPINDDSDSSILISSRNMGNMNSHILEVVDPASGTSRQIRMEETDTAGIAPLPDDHVAVLNRNGSVRIFQVANIRRDFNSWRELLGLSNDISLDGEGNALSIEYFRNEGADGMSTSPPSLSAPKLGKWDDKNEAHVGGNQWAGGTGGSDTAGLGGRGGPYRLDRGHRVHQVSDALKAEVSKEATAAAREMAQKALQEKLSEIGMSEQEWKMYERLVEPIRGDIDHLKGLLTAVQSKKSERIWIKRQSHGELDDSKLVDGAAGEKYIYKRRSTGEPNDATVIDRAKRIRFVMDCSGSMYRFNGRDGRLNRSLEAAALIMESFDGMERRFDYSIVGHSGDSPCIELVDFGHPPKSARERMRVLQTMVAHSQYCQSGDSTLEAIKQAMVDVVGGDTENADECVVIAMSDANLARYGIRPRALGDVLKGKSGRQHLKNVPKAFCIFIASFGSEAEEIKRELPVGRGFLCNNTSELPGAVRDIVSFIA